MRLLIITTVPETLAFILSKQPRYLNNYFEVALATSYGPDVRILENEGVPVHIVSMVRRINPFKDLVSLWQMVHLLNHLRPDIIHSYTPKAGLVSMLAALICRVPVRVHTFTGLIWPNEKGWRKRLLMAIDWLLCLCATHVVPEGLGVKNDMESVHITAKPLRIIGHGNIAGVDVDLFSPTADGITLVACDLKQRFAIQENDFVFIYVGRLNRDKGLKELLSAFEQLPENSRLLVVGELDNSLPIDSHTLQTIQSHPRVHWLGFQYDVRPALIIADVLVLPSYREGFSNVLLQAGAMELPVIGTNISGCNEIIEPGLNGWLVPKRDVKELTQAMLISLKTPKSILFAMGCAARARIVERFEQREHWQRMVAYYRSLGCVARQRCANPKLLVIAGLAESIMNFRGDLLRGFQGKGFDIHVAAPGLLGDGVFQREFASFGWQVHGVPLKRTGMSPLADLRTLWNLWRMMRQVRPEYVLSYTIKPVIYGSLAAWLAGIPGRYAMITGLGYSFMGNDKRSKLAWLVRYMYKMALRKVTKVIFQNGDDEELFKQMKLLSPHSESFVINGSGVNLAQFAVAPLPESGINFLLIARLLGDKGVREFALAAQQVKAMHPEVRFTLVGWIDENPDSIKPTELAGWVDNGSLEYLGRLSDVRLAIEQCSVFVLPSYREGMPRSVLEAMAMGRAIITTDSPGCRQTVIDGYNGFLVPIKSVDALVVAMEHFIHDPTLAAHMGKRSRQLAEDKYDVHKVNDVIMKKMGIR